MNKAILMGRLTKDPEVRYYKNAKDEDLAIARYTLAIDRRGRHAEGQPTADFIPCVAFGKNGEFAEKYFRQGTKIAITGHIQTGSYTNKDGLKVYTTDVIIDEQEFAESKKSEGQIDSEGESKAPESKDGFMNIPEGIEMDLPFK